jgi:hypothetical protein
VLKQPGMVIRRIENLAGKNRFVFGEYDRETVTMATGGVED